jgi:AhpD family alkylhydroperoxidase
MTWIRTVPYAAATGRLKQLYDRIKGPGNTVDNIMMAHSLRPHGMEGHMALYKNVLHHYANTVPPWFLETLGVYVSALNGCAYCVDHHSAGLKRLLKDDARHDALHAALVADTPETVLDGRDLAAVRYARLLTRDPAAVTETAIAALRDAGLRRRRDPGDQPGRRLFRLRQPYRARPRRRHRRRCAGPVAERLRRPRQLVARLTGPPDRRGQRKTPRRRAGRGFSV